MNSKKQSTTQIIKLDNNRDLTEDIIETVKGQIQSKAKIFVGDKEITDNLWIDVEAIDEH